MHTKRNNFNLVCIFLWFSGKFFDCLHTKVEKIILVCICFWFTGWILLKIHTIFLIKQIGMHKGDLSREFYPNFTYQIVFTHFGMYILDCHDFLAKISQWRGENGLPRPKGLAMTGELIAVLLLAMSRTHPRAYRVLLCKTRGNDML